MESIVMIPTYPLQGMCSAGLKGYEYLTDFEFIKAFTCTFADSMGLLVFGMLVYGGVSLSIYIRTGSAMIPLVLLLLTGGVVMSQVAAPVVGVATILLLVMGAGILTILYRRYSR
jgi:hypothetical protein